MSISPLGRLFSPLLPMLHRRRETKLSDHSRTFFRPSGLRYRQVLLFLFSFLPSLYRRRGAPPPPLGSTHDSTAKEEEEEREGGNESTLRRDGNGREEGGGGEVERKGGREPRFQDLNLNEFLPPPFTLSLSLSLPLRRRSKERRRRVEAMRRKKKLSTGEFAFVKKFSSSNFSCIINE